MGLSLPLVLPFSKIDKDDTGFVGGKSANLGEMIRAGFPVPNGFCLTTAAYDLFLKENDLAQKIYGRLKNTDTNNPENLSASSSYIQGLVKRGKIPDTIIREVLHFYRKLSGHFSKANVAVRSSATAEDMPKTSFAGMGATFLNVKGEANLLENIKACWASLFTARSIFYRVQNKIPHPKVKISVIVQKMIQSEVSGVMFSIDPLTNDKEKIVIEAVWGLGEMIVQGSVIPDHYVVQKETFSILSKELAEQEVALQRVKNETKQVKVSEKLKSKQKITDGEIKSLAVYADKLQKHYYFPQDIEWAKEKGKLFIIQTRPVTTLNSKNQIKTSGNKNVLTPIIVGAPASPGIAFGKVKIVKKPKEIGKIEKGDILVATMTSPDYVPAMKKAAAIITDEGGLTSHAAIVSRELGVPCIVGTKNATKKLPEGSLVTVDGEIGEVYWGSQNIKKEVFTPSPELIRHKTATKIYLNMAEPEKAKEASRLPVDGVGLLRAEFMVSGIGIHPKEAIKLKKQNQYIAKLTDGLTVFCKNFYPRPVIYRATDFKTNEYRGLSGGKYWEPIEPNPLMGFRGALRYITNPEVFNLELTALSNVRKNYSNLHLMIPFVRSPEELRKVKSLVAAAGLFEKPGFNFWMMVELPVNVILIEEFLKVGINGVSIGSNDLTMLTEGSDRDNAEVASSFDERSEAILWSIKRVIGACSKYRVTTSICGQAPSQYQDFVEKLVKMGITSISVNPDAVYRVKNSVIEAERKI